MSRLENSRHKFGPHGPTSKGRGHPIMFGKPKECLHFADFPDGGGYPKRFIEWAYETMQVTDYESVVHLCSGSLLTGIRVDLRPETKPTIVGDCRYTGLPSSSYRWIMADPPYSLEYARNLYGTEAHYPKPGQIVKEAARLLVPGGLFGIMHFIVPFPAGGLKIKGVYGITQGCGFAIRAWTLMEKPI